ncbi:hypothetical protein Mjas_06035 [Methanothermococcus sp. Ax23]|uniref:hypothetical protein n=1 Tax=Methanothermococcus sp. Ax23 TaxID=3156486 RepID=UPI003BA314C8
MKPSTILFGALASLLIIGGIYAYNTDTTVNGTISNAVNCLCGSECNFTGQESCICGNEYHHSEEDGCCGMAYRHGHGYRHGAQSCAYHNYDNQ